MDLSNASITDDDRGQLEAAFKQFLENRQSMMDGMTSVEDSSYFRGVIVDAVISGLMSHFHEVARYKSAFASELADFGGNFATYVGDRVPQVSSIFIQLGAHIPRGQTPAEGRPPGKR